MFKENSWFKFKSKTAPSQEALPKETSSKRLRLAFEALLKLQVGQVEVKGKEHLAEIPKDRKVIIATTHLSDLDVPLAVAALGDDLDLAIVNMSVHHSASLSKGEPNTLIGLLAAGKDNFIPVDFDKDPKTGQKSSAPFNPENFEPMLTALAKGKRILMAAHNPSKDFKFDRAGYGAAYLAEISGAVILPVAVHLKSDGQVGMYGTGAKTFLKKPDAEVVIGAPLELTKIDHLERLGELLEQRKISGRLTPEEIKEFSALRRALEEQSKKLLQKLADLLPAKN